MQYSKKDHEALQADRLRLKRRLKKAKKRLARYEGWFPVQGAANKPVDIRSLISDSLELGFRLQRESIRQLNAEFEPEFNPTGEVSGAALRIGDTITIRKPERYTSTVKPAGITVNGPTPYTTIQSGPSFDEVRYAVFPFETDRVVPCIEYSTTDEEENDAT